MAAVPFATVTVAVAAERVPTGSASTATTRTSCAPSSTVVESVSDEKQTRLGRGHFVTWVTTYTVEGGEVVGRQRFRILKFAPEASA